MGNVTAVETLQHSLKIAIYLSYLNLYGVHKPRFSARDKSQRVVQNGYILVVIAEIRRGTILECLCEKKGEMN